MESGCEPLCGRTLPRRWHRVGVDAYECLQEVRFDFKEELVVDPQATSISDTRTPRRMRKLRRMAVVMLTAVIGTLGAVVATAAPASAAEGFACWRDGNGVIWPQYPPGSIYVTRVYAQNTIPAAVCGNIADPNGIAAVSYIPPGDLHDGALICWRWTNRLAGNHNLPAPWLYRDGFVTWPSCREGANLGDPSARDAAREVYRFQPPPPPPPVVNPPTVCGRITAGQGLFKNQWHRSCDGRFTLSFQGDGNLVLYHGGTPLWASNTPSNAEVVGMQGDGNFVIYGLNGAAIWSTNTHGHPGALLGIQDDGNVVIYTPGGTGIWSTNTCCH